MSVPPPPLTAPNGAAAWRRLICAVLALVFLFAIFEAAIHLAHHADANAASHCPVAVVAAHALATVVAGVIVVVVSWVRAGRLVAEVPCGPARPALGLRDARAPPPLLSPALG